MEWDTASRHLAPEDLSLEDALTLDENRPLSLSSFRLFFEANEVGMTLYSLTY